MVKIIIHIKIKEEKNSLHMECIFYKLIQIGLYFSLVRIN